MKVLITGINGFIGKHLAKSLLQRGHTVYGIAKDKTCQTPGVARYYSGSVLQKRLVSRAMQDAEVVVHLAAVTAHNEIVDNKFKALELNFLGTKNILDAFLRSKTAQKFLYSSTGKVYGKIMQLPITEIHPTLPLNVLGKSKLITEQLIDFAANNQKAFLIFRIFNIYGPGQKSSFLVPTILKQFAQGKHELLLGDTQAKRDYVFIDDLIRAFVLAIEKKDLKGISQYNICTGIGTSATEIVNQISKLTGKKISLKSNAALIRQDEMKDEYGSFAFAKKVFGWEPKIHLAEGLRKLLD